MQLQETLQQKLKHTSERKPTMPNMNIDNFLQLTGRIETKDMSKAILENKDGSRKIRFTMAVQDNYRKKDGTQSKQDIPVEAFIPAAMVKVENGVESYGIYSTLRTGDNISIIGHLEDNNYQDANGKMVYGGIIVRIDALKHRESKSTADARAAQKAAAAAVAAPADAE